MSKDLDGRALLENTLQWLARTPAVLRAHAQGQSRETLDQRPGGNGWSQTEILAHLADFEVVCFQVRVERILRGETIHSVNGDERAAEIPYAAISPFTSLEVFEQERERSLACIRQLSPDQLGRRAVHSELGEITLGSLLTEWVRHDLSHIRQLVTTAAQVFRPDAKPWAPGSRSPEASIQVLASR